MTTTDLLLDKNKVIESFQGLPDEVSADALIEHIEHILFNKLIENRIQSAEAGNVTDHETFLKEMKSWRK